MSSSKPKPKLPSRAPRQGRQHVDRMVAAGRLHRLPAKLNALLGPVDADATVETDVAAPIAKRRRGRPRKVRP